VTSRRSRTGLSCGRSGAGAPGSFAERGLSPVVGAVLLIAVAVVLAAVAGSLFLGLGDESSPAPSVSLDLEPAPADATALVHDQGAVLDGDRIRLRGVADADALVGRDLAAGQSVTVAPTRDTVTVVWFDPDSEASYTIAELDVPERANSASGGLSSGGSDALDSLAGDVFTTNASGILAIEGDGGDVGVVANTGAVAATGSATTDITGDGDRDVPFVDTGGTVAVADASGDVTTVAQSTDIPGSIETSKTRLATGSWDGSPASVFFVNENHDRLYRAAPGGSPVQVAAPGDGVQAVLGIGDIDADGTDELVFADASQQVRYVDPDGTGGTDVEVVANAQAGSNNGVGAGTLADLDGDGTPAVVVADGSNDLVISREASGGGTETIALTVEADEAAKAPLTAADVDGDSTPELVYVTSDDGGRVVRYVDDVGGANTLRVLNDDDGDAVVGSDETGAT